MFDRIFLVMKMKKLLLCILSLMLCLNTSVIHAQEPESLMIVAHPDDETIWGGSHLINGNYTVLCITNGNNKKRKKEFMKVMEKTHSKAIILSFFRNFSQNLYTENFNEKYFLHIQIASAEPANGSFFRMHDKKRDNQN